MSKRAVLVLAAVVAALFAYILVFERTSPSTKELEQRKGRVLATFVRERVDRLELQRKGKLVVLERKPLDTGDMGSWQMLQPEAVVADQDAVDQVLGELEWLSARRTLENVSAADAKSFGLDAPRYRITYQVGGKRYVLVVGNPDVHAQSVYVRLQGEPQVYVVPKTLTEALDHDPNHYRSKEFLGGLTMAWARDVEIVTAAETVHLTRTADRWWFEGEPKSYGDAKRIDDVLSALNELRATRYLEAGPVLSAAEVGLAKPELSVRVRVVPDEKREDQEPRLLELRVGAACPEHAGERLARAGEKGPVVCLTEDALKPFQAEPVSFRQAGLLGVDASQVERLELRAGNRKLALRRDGENWTAEAGVTVDREAVESWLADLTIERARGFFALSPISETARFTAFLAGGKQTTLILGGATPDRSVQVHRDDEPALVTFQPGVRDLLDPAPERFATLEPWSTHQPSEVVAVEAQEAAYNRSLVYQDGHWQAGSAALPAEADLRVRELVKGLVKLRLRSFVTERARPEHGLSPARASVALRLKVETGKPAQELRLEIGAESEHGYFARLDAGKVVEVTPSVVEQIRELAGGPAVPMPAPAPAEDELDEDHGHEH